MPKLNDTHQKNITKKEFDPFEKERLLREESLTWDTSKPTNAAKDDIPIIDLASYFTTGSAEALGAVADELRHACEEVGFFSIVGHQIPHEITQIMFTMIEQFHDLSIEEKLQIKMDRPDWPVGGVGYLPFKNRKLPARDTGNRNEAFVLKCDHRISMRDNQWLDESLLPEFRQTSEAYAHHMVELGMRMLPIFARALEMPANFFDQAFLDPLYRLRMTHYPPAEEITEDDEFGIAPHVDTSFCTILAQDQPGLSIYSEKRSAWLNVPMIEGGFIVNSGELLRQWTNDRFLSVKHFVKTNISGVSRYAIPFFFNANSQHKMVCVPSCCGPDNPPKYPPLSYEESQAVAQGE
ncbi:isopenicillin N synthase family oxygenase [Alteromonadaceae bacterium M269]|nr:isopenicillin N synthase family oxygenase [Alteromonadaceae bacterium M269]